MLIAVPFLVQLLRVRSPALLPLLHLPHKLGMFHLHLRLQIAAVLSLRIERQVCEEFANGLVGKSGAVIISIFDIQLQSQGQLDVIFGECTGVKDVGLPVVPRSSRSAQ